MGWRWHDDDGDGGRGLGDIPDLAAGRGDGEGAHRGTRLVVQSRCRTEEVEPGRFVRKCEKTEQLLRDCVGRYSPQLALFLDPFSFSCKNRLSACYYVGDCVVMPYVESIPWSILILVCCTDAPLGNWNDLREACRPSELVESKTENTEEDVTDEMKGASHSLGFPTKEPFAFPGLRSDIEAIEKGFSGSLSSFLDEAERMTHDLLKSFAFPATHDAESRPFPQQPAERHIGEGTMKKADENEYSKFGSQITDV